MVNRKKRKGVVDYLLCLIFEERFIMRDENVFCPLIQLDLPIRFPKIRAGSVVFVDRRPSAGNGISKHLSFFLT